MALLVLLMLVALPFAELAVIVWIAGDIGVLDTVGLLVLVSLVGGWVTKQAGLGVINRMRTAQREGRVPSREVADGAFVLLAGGLLVFPGFITDVMAVALLFPPSRAAIRALTLRYFEQRGPLVVVGRRHSPDDHDTSDPDVWDVESWEEPPRSRPRGQIGGGS